MAVHVGDEWRSLMQSVQPDTGRELNVIVVNLDLSGSGLMSKTLPPWDLLRSANQLQSDIQRCFGGDNWLVGDWSGDGLVALSMEPAANADLAVTDAARVCERVTTWRQNLVGQSTSEDDRAKLSKVNVRIGICTGTIYWWHTPSTVVGINADPFNTGRIIAEVMNEAGHLQKECDPGTLLICDVTYKRLSALRQQFPLALTRTIRHRDTRLLAHEYVARVPGPRPERVTQEEIALRALAGCEVVARAPGACYFFGEHAVMFGYPALLQPLPLYAYVGIRCEDQGPTHLIYEPGDGYVVKPDLDLYDPNVVTGLRFPQDFNVVKWSSEECEHVRDAVRVLIESGALPADLGTIRVKTCSFVPQKCGLNASSAISLALAGALQPDLLQKALEKMRKHEVGRPLYVEGGDALSEYIKSAWAFDNVFHGNAASGCGVMGCAMGTRNGWPIIYVAEARGFQDPYPIVFEPLRVGRDDRSSEPLRRIRAVATFTDPGNVAHRIGHEYALFHVSERPKSTRDLISSLLAGGGFRTGMVDTLREVLESIGHRQQWYLPKEFLAKAIELSRYGDTGAFSATGCPKLNRDIELLVEGFMQALGACTMSGVGAFIDVDHGFQKAEFGIFARCMNAYQELMSACNLSGDLADLFNYKSDAFAYEDGGEDNAGGGGETPERSRLPYGTKLTGAGQGGDFVVVAPTPAVGRGGRLQKDFRTFRHAMRIGGRDLPCHYVSWSPGAEFGGVALVCDNRNPQP